MMSSFRAFLDFGTTVAFLAAPVIALLNHRAVFGAAVPEALRPGRGMWIWSLVGIVALAMFSVFDLYLLLAGY